MLGISAVILTSPFVLGLVHFPKELLRLLLVLLRLLLYR